LLEREVYINEVVRVGFHVLLLASNWHYMKRVVISISLLQ